MKKFTLTICKEIESKNYVCCKINELAGPEEKESIIVYVAKTDNFKDFVELNIVYDEPDTDPESDYHEIETSRTIASGPTAKKFVLLLTGIDINTMRGL